MNPTLNFAIVLIFGCFVGRSIQQDSDAVRECGNLHHLEFRNLPNAHGEFSNSQCNLKCSVGDKTLSNDAVNEGFPCPGDANGVCHLGQCQLTQTGAQTEALRECGNLHRINFHSGSGTTYLNNQCMLKCVLNRNVVSQNAVNEGYPCPGDSSKICRNGQCVLEHATNPPVQATTLPPTTLTPTKNIRPPWDQFDLSQFKLTVQSAALTHSYDTYYADVCVESWIFDGNGKKPTHCRLHMVTEQATMPTSHPKFSLSALFTGPFLENDWAFIRLFGFTKRGDIHSVVEIGDSSIHLQEYFAVHYAKPSTVKSGDNSNFEFKDNFTLYSQQHSSLPIRENPGDVVIAFQVLLQKKQQDSVSTTPKPSLFDHYSVTKIDLNLIGANVTVAAEAFSAEVCRQKVSVQETCNCKSGKRTFKLTKEPEISLLCHLEPFETHEDLIVHLYEYQSSSTVVPIGKVTFDVATLLNNNFPANHSPLVQSSFYEFKHRYQLYRNGLTNEMVEIEFTVFLERKGRI